MVDTTVQENYVSLKDGKVFYLKQGQGYPLIMLHAADISFWTWRKVIGLFSENFECYCPDMPGFDLSDTPPDTYSIPRFTEAIIEFMDKLEIQKAHFLGETTGAVVSFNLAASYPDRVDKLVLENSPAWNKREGLIVLEKWIIPNLNEYGGVGPLTYEEAVKINPAVDREWVDRLGYAARKYGKWVTKAHEASANYDMTEKAGDIKAPTLLVYPENGVIRKRERLNQDINGSVLKLIPDCNTPHYDASGYFAKEVTSFLLN